MSKSNNCRLCTGGGEGAKVLYRYSPSDYQIDADCKYSSLEECESINNPRKSYISPAECLVWFNDNGGEVVNNGTYVFQNMYGQSNNVNPIPSTMNGNMAVTDWNTVGQTHSRLWAYDVTGNTLYYVDSFTHEGNDIAVAQNMMFVGCESKDESGADTRNSSIVSYNYQITNNDTTTFTKTPQKTYRFVNHLGYLIRDNGGNASWAQYEKVGLGNSIGGISDSELIIDDHGGSIWYANLDDNWSGTSIYSSDDTDSVWTASNSIDNQGYPYLDLDTYTPDLGDSLGRWKHCTYGTENRIYTIRCKLLVNAGKGSELSLIHI